MKRYAMPGFWPLARKVKKFVITPSAGPHAKQSSIALRIVIRDVLGLAENAQEASKIIKGGEVLIDKKAVKNDNHPVGLMDVVQFPRIKKQFRILPSRKGLEVVEIDARQAARKLCSVKKKKMIKGGKTQLTLHDGRTIVGKENKYKPGDSLLIEVPAQKILGHFEMKEGVPAIIVAGKNSGSHGKIKKIEKRKTMMEKSSVVLDTKEGEIETLMEYILVSEIK
ncbi:MAG: 30S ribosomal protein S4e [Candidatus Aenigmatarchaeota archaeon]|nr:MAG: 30S ribosomal protein S4e [Candidatus Aenigmarchaeota archaeon]